MKIAKCNMQIGDLTGTLWARLRRRRHFCDGSGKRAEKAFFAVAGMDARPTADLLFFLQHLPFSNLPFSKRTRQYAGEKEDVKKGKWEKGTWGKRIWRSRGTARPSAAIESWCSSICIFQFSFCDLQFAISLPPESCPPPAFTFPRIFLSSYFCLIARPAPLRVNSPAASIGKENGTMTATRV